MNNKSLISRIQNVNEAARQLFKTRKRDTLVLIAPADNKKGWMVDVCTYIHKDGDNHKLRKKLESCNTMDELKEALDGYATNVPNVQRSDEYET